jgi:hypothetical protein
MESPSTSPTFGTRSVFAWFLVPSQRYDNALISVLLPASTSSEQRQNNRDSRGRHIHCPLEVLIRLARQVLCKCLDDEVVEVREMAATYVR